MDTLKCALPSPGACDAVLVPSCEKGARIVLGAPGYDKGLLLDAGARSVGALSPAGQTAMMPSAAREQWPGMRIDAVVLRPYMRS